MSIFRKHTVIGLLLLSAALIFSACQIKPIEPVPTAEEAAPEVPEGPDRELIAPYLEQKPIPLAGEVQKQTIVGAAAGEQTFFVYLPEGYDASDQQYKTIYHLHGAYLQEPWAGYECTYLGSQVENAVAAGIIDPMIVVCLVDPDGDRMWSDSFDGQYLASTAFTEDLIPHIDATYPTVAERSGRILQGFSMGGFGTIANGFRTPELFNAIVVWDGALHSWPSITAGRPQIAEKMFDTEDYFNNWSPWALIQQGADVEMDMFMVVGSMQATRAFGDAFKPVVESTGREFTYFDSECPHSIFCLVDELGKEAFTFMADSLMAADDMAADNMADADMADADMAHEISVEMPYETQFVEVNGSQMAYVEAGEGDPILFLHGNPTSKYLWRNIMPWLEDQGRVIAPDLIGMGESDKPEIGYTFVEHAEYVAGFIDAMGLENITLVIHDWGSGLGFDYANRHRENVKAIAFMEAAITPGFPPNVEELSPENVQFLQVMRTPGMGEDLMLNKNMMIEQFLRNDVVRELTEEEMAAYRAPFPDPESRKPMLVWVRSIPVDGEPADVAERVAAYNDWFMTSELPKLHLYVSPGAIITPDDVEFLKEQGVPNYEAIFLGEGSHFIQEDYPHEIGQHIAEWYSRVK